MKKIFLIVLTAVCCLPVFAQTYKGSDRNRTAGEKLNEQYCTGLFKTTNGTILDLGSDNARGYINIISWMESRVAGLEVYTSKTGLKVPLLRGGVPALYVDENPVTLSYLNSMNINDIAIIKVIKTPFLGGFNGGNGAIAVYTVMEEEEENGTD
jgi:hypothetical protein